MDYDIRKSTGEIFGNVSPDAYDFIYYKTVTDRNGDSVEIVDHIDTHSVSDLKFLIAEKQAKSDALTAFIAQQPVQAQGVV